MKRTLWTRDFTRITAATALGAAGGIISQFALSFLVFDETGSTLAAALSVAIQLIPMVLLPLIIAPMMDRLPRKPFLVWGDLLNGVCYAGAGIFLLHNAFSYTAYLAFSLLIYAGLDAIAQRLLPPAAADVNFYSAPEEVLRQFKTLPATLDEAIAVMRESAFVREHIPQKIIDIYSRH